MEWKRIHETDAPGFVLSGQYVGAQRDLWCEIISWGENHNTHDFFHFRFKSGKERVME